MLAFHMFCGLDNSAAIALARQPLNNYLGTLVDAASGWTSGGADTADYPGYDRIIAGLAQETFDTQVAKGAAWVGGVGEISQQIAEYNQAVGGFDIASLQVNFSTISVEDAEASMRLFSTAVMPQFKNPE